MQHAVIIVFIPYFSSQCVLEGGESMNHSGWKKLDKVNGQLKSYHVKFLFIFLLTCGILFTYPEAASTSDIKETDFIYFIKGNERISSGHMQKMESIYPGGEINLKGEKDPQSIALVINYISIKN